MELNPSASHGCAVAQLGRGKQARSSKYCSFIQTQACWFSYCLGWLQPEASAVKTMRSHQSRKVRLKEIAVYVYKLSKQTNQAFL